jgi:ankyrin repeat protein
VVAEAPKSLDIRSQIATPHKTADGQGVDGNHLHMTAANTTPDFIDVARSEDYDSNMPDAEGLTPLHLEAANVAIDTVAVLLKRGAEPTVVENRPVSGTFIGSPRTCGVHKAPFERSDKQ